MKDRRTTAPVGCTATGGRRRAVERSRFERLRSTSLLLVGSKLTLEL
jgi:hypothetical protein